jgi:hypothetical protein
MAASDNLDDVVSCSWGEAELNSFANALTGGQDTTFHVTAFAPRSPRWRRRIDGVRGRESQRSVRGQWFRNGGTSFVATQFAGTLAPMVDKLGHRAFQPSTQSAAGEGAGRRA